jgi:hypothetical protein
MPKLKYLQPMPPDHPFYRSGYLVGVVVLRKKSPLRARIVPSRARGELS